MSTLIQMYHEFEQGGQKNVCNGCTICVNEGTNNEEASIADASSDSLHQTKRKAIPIS